MRTGTGASGANSGQNLRVVASIGDEGDNRSPRRGRISARFLRFLTAHAPAARRTCCRPVRRHMRGKSPAAIEKRTGAHDADAFVLADPDSSTLVGSESRNKTVHVYAAWRQTHDGTRKIWHKFDRQSSIGYHLRLRFSRSHADSGQDSIRAPSGDGPKHNRYVITDWSSKTRGVRPFLEGLSSTRRQGDTYSGGDVAETRALLRER